MLLLLLWRRLRLWWLLLSLLRLNHMLWRLVHDSSRSLGGLILLLLLLLVWRRLRVFLVLRDWR